MDLAEDVQHSLIVVSCLIDSWTLIRDRALPAAHARYPTVVRLRAIPSAEVGEALIAAYLRAAYTRAGFTPPYPTWPVPSTAFADAPLFSPRSLLNLVQEHCARCRENGRVTELEQLPNERPQGPEPLPNERRRGADPPQPPPPDPELDRRFRQLVQEADVADVLDEKKVDGGLPALLRAGLTAWAAENAGAGDFSVDPPPGRKSSAACPAAADSRCGHGRCSALVVSSRPERQRGGGPAPAAGRRDGVRARALGGAEAAVRPAQRSVVAGQEDPAGARRVRGARRRRREAAGG